MYILVLLVVVSAALVYMYSFHCLAASRVCQGRYTDTERPGF